MYPKNPSLAKMKTKLSQFTVEILVELFRSPGAFLKDILQLIQRARSLLAHFAATTSLHGFKQIHDNKGSRKYIWFTSLLLAITLVIVLFQRWESQPENTGNYFTDIIRERGWILVTRSYFDGWVTSATTQLRRVPIYVSHSGTEIPWLSIHLAHWLDTLNVPRGTLGV